MKQMQKHLLSLELSQNMLNIPQCENGIWVQVHCSASYSEKSDRKDVQWQHGIHNNQPLKSCIDFKVSYPCNRKENAFGCFLLTNGSFFIYISNIYNFLPSKYMHTFNFSKSTCKVLSLSYFLNPLAIKLDGCFL